MKWATTILDTNRNVDWRNQRFTNTFK